MQCPSCGNQNKPGAHFCAYCGSVLDESSGTLRAGQMVDGNTYRILRLLGKGGMGAVYLAENTKAFDRQCVVKEVIEYYDPADPEARQKALERFKSEARTLASLKHPGIPDIYAYFSERGRNYLVMEYIEGPNLAQNLTREVEGQIVQGHPEPVEEVVQRTIQVCEVLVYLEQRQPPVIHNDIKPANIILDENSGRAVLVDFGTAKTRYARQAAGQPGLGQSSVYGTVGYAAAELYEGKAEPRSDVYALAATTYHLLTDDDPRAHPFQFPKMDTLPEPLPSVLGDALQVEVAQRPSAAQFKTRLEEALRRIGAEAGDTEPPLLLKFPQGEEPASREELIGLCVKYWDRAAEMLYDGSLAIWLSASLGDARASDVAQAAVTRFAENSDAGLDHFIRSLAPRALPAPQLKAITERLRYEEVRGEDASQAIWIANTGVGHLYGTVSTSAPWVKVTGSVNCAPRAHQSLPVVVDAQGLAPGGRYTARVEILPSGLPPVSITIEAHVAQPVIDILPSQIDLGEVAAREMFTEIEHFQVRNRGNGRASCQIEGAPPWLTIAPLAFTCRPGETQEVSLRVKAYELPADRTRHDAILEVKVEGGRPRQVHITLRTQARTGTRSHLSTYLTIGCAGLLLVAAIVFFLAVVLPRLGLL